MQHVTILSIFRAALLASVVSLFAAYVAEYMFGLRPCHLCLLQRIPYAVVIVLAFAGLWQLRFHMLIGLLIGLAFLTGAGIAAYHTGVEQQWVQGPSGCTASETEGVQTMDEFLKKIQAAPIVACDQPQWEFHGITMASLNAVWSLLLGLAAFAACWKARHAPPAR